jgi:hypothetical protein
MSEELVVFLNFTFENKQVTTKILDDSGLKASSASRFLLNWRAYLKALEGIGVYADSDRRPLSHRYLSPQSTEELYQSLVAFQNELRGLLKGIVTNKKVPREAWKRIFRESDGLPASVSLPEGFEEAITELNVGPLRLSLNYDSPTYRATIMATLRDLIVSGRVFDICVDAGGRFSLGDAKPRAGAPESGGHGPLPVGDPGKPTAGHSFSLFTEADKAAELALEKAMDRALGKAMAKAGSAPSAKGGPPAMAGPAAGEGGEGAPPAPQGRDGKRAGKSPEMVFGAVGEVPGGVTWDLSFLSGSATQEEEILSVDRLGEDEPLLLLDALEPANEPGPAKAPGLPEATAPADASGGPPGPGQEWGLASPPDRPSPEAGAPGAAAPAQDPQASGPQGPLAQTAPAPTKAGPDGEDDGGIIALEDFVLEDELLAGGPPEPKAPLEETAPGAGMGPATGGPGEGPAKEGEEGNTLYLEDALGLAEPPGGAAQGIPAEDAPGQGAAQRGRAPEAAGDEGEGRPTDGPEPPRGLLGEGRALGESPGGPGQGQAGPAGHAPGLMAGAPPSGALAKGAPGEAGKFGGSQEEPMASGPAGPEGPTEGGMAPWAPKPEGPGNENQALEANKAKGPGEGIVPPADYMAAEPNLIPLGDTAGEPAEAPGDRTAGEAAEATPAPEDCLAGGSEKAEDPPSLVPLGSPGPCAPPDAPEGQARAEGAASPPQGGPRSPGDTPGAPSLAQEGQGREEDEAITLTEALADDEPAGQGEPVILAEAGEGPPRGTRLGPPIAIGEDVLAEEPAYLAPETGPSDPPGIPAGPGGGPEEPPLNLASEAAKAVPPADDEPGLEGPLGDPGPQGPDAPERPKALEGLEAPWAEEAPRPALDHAVISMLAETMEDDDPIVGEPETRDGFEALVQSDLPAGALTLDEMAQEDEADPMSSLGEEPLPAESLRAKAYREVGPEEPEIIHSWFQEEEGHEGAESAEDGDGPPEYPGEAGIAGPGGYGVGAPPKDYSYEYAEGPNAAQAPPAGAKAAGREGAGPSGPPDFLPVEYLLSTMEQRIFTEAALYKGRPLN